jgi:Uma2 family endonuclease
MPQAVLRKDDGYNRLAISADMLAAMVSAGTIEDPARVELIEGELVTLSPVYRQHARMTSKLNAALHGLVGNEFEVLENISVRLSDFNEPIADLCVVEIGSDSGVVLPAECALVVEISESTAQRDRQLKAPIYAKAGIAELWIIDLNANQTIIHRQPSAEGWGETTTHSFTEELSPLFDPAIKLVVANI